MMVVLVCLGAAIAEGSVFGAFSWKVALLAAGILLVVRPLSAWVCLLRVIGHHSLKRA